MISCTQFCQIFKACRDVGASTPFPRAQYCVVLFFQDRIRSAVTVSVLLKKRRKVCLEVAHLRDPSYFFLPQLGCAACSNKLCTFTCLKSTPFFVCHVIETAVPVQAEHCIVMSRQRPLQKHVPNGVNKRRQAPAKKEKNYRIVLEDISPPEPRRSVPYKVRKPSCCVSKQG